MATLTITEQGDDPVVISEQDTGLQGGVPPLSGQTPLPIGIADSGAGTDASREDHVHAASLADLDDVLITDPQHGQVLAFDADLGKWINRFVTWKG